MEFIQDIYLKLFINLYKLVYPLFKNPAFPSYISVFAIVAFCSWKNYKWLKRNPFFFQKKEIHIMPAFRFLVEVFLLGFLAWFLLVHINTINLV